MTDVQDVKVVIPDNMGKGIVWNKQNKQYEVALGSGLYFDDKGLIQMQSNDPVINYIDNGTGKIVHKQAIIDFGEVLEVSGTVILPLAPTHLVGLPDTDPLVNAERERLQEIYPNSSIKSVKTATETQNWSDTRQVFYTETGYEIDLFALGIKQVISVNATAGDVLGYRKETAWAIDDFSQSKQHIVLGVHVYYTEEQETCPLSYTIKGTKA